MYLGKICCLFPAILAWLTCIHLVCCHYQYRYHYLPTYPSSLRKSFGPLFKITQGPRVVNHHQAFGETRSWHLSNSKIHLRNPGYTIRILKKNINMFFKIYSAPNSKRGIKKTLQLPPSSTNHRAPHNQWHSEKIPVLGQFTHTSPSQKGFIGIIHDLLSIHICWQCC